MLRKIFININGLLLFGLAVFLTISFLSYHASDPSFHKAVEVREVANWGGGWGAYVAGPLIHGFGFSLILPVLFLLYAGIKLVTSTQNVYLIIRLSVMLVTLPLLSWCLSSAGRAVGVPYELGGVLGQFIFDEVSLHYSSRFTPLLGVFLSMVGVVFCLDIKPVTLVSVLSKCVRCVALLMFKIWYFTYYLYARLMGKSDILPEVATSKGGAVAKPQPRVSKAALAASGDRMQVYSTESCGFVLPSSTLLKEVVEKNKKGQLSPALLQQNAQLLQQVLKDFGVLGSITQINPGPVVTLYEFEPVAGTKSSRVIGLSDDIARSMSSISARIAVIPGKTALGIELPNAHREIVALRELVESKSYRDTTDKLPLILGKSIAGEPVVADLAKMPHLLVAGTTGSGKSVAINTMILSLLYAHSPEECRFIMIDPKMLELSVYEGIPHLLAPVVTEPKKAISALKWVVKEMENRYRLMSMLGVRNLDGYNELISNAVRAGQKVQKQVQIGFDGETGKPKYEAVTVEEKHLPYIVVIVDEMADLMIVAGKDIEASIQRLAQMARAAGIHIIMATQRPSVDVITGVIKANFPTRISFQVTSKIDSRTILGEQGADQLLGMGDMLFMRGGGRIERVHGPFVSDAEVESIASFLKAQGRPEYIEAVTRNEDEEDEESGAMSSSGDDLYDKALSIVLKERKASTSYIQRCLRIGYNRAASIMEKMEREGVVSPANHVGKRDVLVGEE